MTLDRPHADQRHRLAIHNEERREELAQRAAARLETLSVDRGQSVADAQSTFVGGGASGMDGGDDVPLVHLDAQAEPEGERVGDVDLARLAALLRAADGVAGVQRGRQVDVVRGSGAVLAAVFPRGGCHRLLLLQVTRLA